MRTFAIAALAICLTPTVASAQSDEMLDPTGEIHVVPFDSGLEVVNSGRRYLEGEHYLFEDYDVDLATCSSAFTALFESDAEVAENWMITGRGEQSADEQLRFTLQFREAALYTISLEEHDGGCRMMLRATAHPIAGDYYRVSLPDFAPHGGDRVEVDPLAPLE